MKWKKYFICSLALLPAFLSLFSFSNVSAVSIGTASLGLKKTLLHSIDYQWQLNIGYNQIISTQAVNEYQFTTGSFTPAGNTLNIHFETNIVAYSFSRNYINFVNLPHQSIKACSLSNGTGVVSSSSLSSVVTDWTTSEGAPAATVTFYGDVVMTGVTPNVAQTLTCWVGSNSYAFFNTSNLANSANLYFEKNPINILYSHNISDSLLQNQINLQETQNSLIQNQINLEQTQNSLIQNQSNQQQQQYNEEKQEESQREESGNESADEMAGVFNFSIPNPFLPILSMFTDGNSCVDIPTIAGMVGSDNTQYCPWFPASVRNVLTPVIGLASSIILFGFIVGWLTGSTRGSIEQVEEVSK